MIRRGIVALALFVLVFPAALEAESPQHGSAAAGDASWERLLAGNRAFVQGAPFCFDDLAARRAATATSQSPRVTVVACADSRVPPELLFHQTLGELFVIRTAGNVVDDFALASLEYGAEHEWTDLIVILGHAGCGAVDAALHPSDPPTPALQTLVSRIRESFVGVPYSTEPAPELNRTATAANARHVAAHLSAHSAALRERIRTGRVKVIPAIYDMASGVVSRVD